MKETIDLETIGAIVIAIISGFVSISRRMLTKRAVSRLWIAYECSGVVLMTMLAMNVYPHIQPLLLSSPCTSWITNWVFVGVLAHCGSRMMYTLEKKVFSKADLL
jgi:hypothetical protein